MVINTHSCYYDTTTAARVAYRVAGVARYAPTEEEDGTKAGNAWRSPLCPVCVQFVSTFSWRVTTWWCERYKILCPCVHFFQLEWTHRNEGEKVCFETRVDLVQRSLQPYLIYISISIYRDIFIYKWTHGHIDPSPYSLLSAYQILRYVSKPQNEVGTKCTQSGHMGTGAGAHRPW